MAGAGRVTKKVVKDNYEVNFMSGMFDHDVVVAEARSKLNSKTRDEKNQDEICKIESDDEERSPERVKVFKEQDDITVNKQGMTAEELEMLE